MNGKPVAARRVVIHLDKPTRDGDDEMPFLPTCQQEVLINLQLNACDACEPGGRVELRGAAEERRLALIVVDDGSSIGADAEARIMDPFFTTKPVGESSGLGLAIANELVKHHRGTLTVAARQGQRGTRASVELPTSAEPGDG